jgi:hypothetical protein
MLSGDAGEMGLRIWDVAGSIDSQILKIFVGVLLKMRLICSKTSENLSMVRCRLDQVEAMQTKQPPNNVLMHCKKQERDRSK